MDTPERDPLESQLRDVLRSDLASPTNTEGFLHDVHRGARSRRRRHVVGSAAAVLLVVGGGFAVAESGVLNTGNTPVATGPTTADVEKSEPPTVPSSTPPDTTPPPVTEESVLSLTSTGMDVQWALALTTGSGCDSTQGCATVYTNPLGTDSWDEIATIPAIPTSDNTQRYSVSQLRFAGDAAHGYNGWAFGGALLTTHGEAAGTTWTKATVPAQGAVTELEAHGDTVFALLEGEGEDASARLLESPVDSDEFTPVHTGSQLGDVSQLVVSEHVVAFLNVVGDTSDIVEQGDGGTWTHSNPCQDGGRPVEFSTAGDALWALCVVDGKTMVVVRPSAAGQWDGNDETYAGSANLAAVSNDTALVAEPGGLTQVTSDGSTHLTDDDFTLATMFGFTNDQVGFVILDGEVLRTDDGGENWTPDKVLP